MAMRPISLAGTRHVRALSSTEPELLLLVVHPDPADPEGDVLKLALNTEDVVYRGDTYIAFAFDLDAIWDQSTGQLQEVRLMVSNVNRMVEGYMQEFGGAVGAFIELVTVTQTDLNGDPLQYLAFDVIAAQSDATWATFTLGAISPLRRKFPKFDYRKDYCMWLSWYNTPARQLAGDRKGARCGYVGALETCDGTLNGTNGCKVHSNAKRFGAFPTIDSTGLFTASPI